MIFLQKNPVFVGVASLLVVSGVYLVLAMNISGNSQDIENTDALFSSTDSGIEFTYRSGPDGYVVKEETITESDDRFAQSIVLMQTKDAERGMPIGGEGPPTITVLVFKNVDEELPQEWADTHVQYSNVNLKTSPFVETTVGGVKAIRYMADGLYASEQVIVAQGENMYLISGMYLDSTSPLRKDFSPFLKSIHFIP